MLRKGVILYDTVDLRRRKKLKGNLKTASHDFSEKESDELPVLTFCLKSLQHYSSLNIPMSLVREELRDV